jgi:nicotinate-nucleotide adenylyltransferase
MTGLFGGSFDPPHLAHLIVAETVREQFELDKVIWIPTWRAPQKVESGHASAEHRLRMVQLAVQDNPGFSVSDLEVSRKGISYTVDTIRQLLSSNPNTYAFILGGDSLEALHTWRQPQEILDLVPLIVYQRGGGETPHLHPSLTGRVSHAKAPQIDISSTMIRLRRRQRQTIRYLVPTAVGEYIEANRLYL